MAFEVDPRAPKEYSSVMMLHLNKHRSIEETIYDYEYYLKEFPVPSLREYLEHNRHIKYSSAATHWTEEKKYVNVSSKYATDILCDHVHKWQEVDLMLQSNNQQSRQAMRFVLEDMADNNFLLTQFRVNYLMIKRVEEQQAMCSVFLGGLNKAIKPLEMVLKSLGKQNRTLKAVKSQLDKLKSQKRLLESYAHKWSIIRTRNQMHQKRIKKAIAARARAVLWLARRRLASK